MQDAYDFTAALFRHDCAGQMKAAMRFIYDAAALGGVAKLASKAKVLPRSGPIPQSLGAASRAEMLAKKLHLNINSATTRQVLNSLDDKVTEFVASYRKASIWRELPGEVAEMSVEEALQCNSTVRKLLIDNRFVK